MGFEIWKPEKLVNKFVWPKRSQNKRARVSTTLQLQSFTERLAFHLQRSLFYKLFSYDVTWLRIAINCARSRALPKRCALIRNQRSMIDPGLKYAEVGTRNHWGSCGWNLPIRGTQILQVHMHLLPTLEHPNPWLLSACAKQTWSRSLRHVRTFTRHQNERNHGCR